MSEAVIGPSAAMLEAMTDPYGGPPTGARTYPQAPGLRASRSNPRVRPQVFNAGPFPCPSFAPAIYRGLFFSTVKRKSLNYCLSPKEGVMRSNRVGCAMFFK